MTTSHAQPDAARQEELARARRWLDAGLSIPRHIAVIMDGNGRWAKARGLPRSAGHAEGAARVRPLTVACSDLGVEAVTLYSFSTENWARSRGEVGFLMDLCVQYLADQREDFLEHRIRFRHLGRREGLPEHVLASIDETTSLTAEHEGMTLCLAINYGGRAEITDAARSIARDVRAGTLDPDEIDEAILEGRLDTAGLPDPDLLIRTAGEMRLSNYLLWQVSYAELYVADVPWPEFDDEQFRMALQAYSARSRRFGHVEEKSPADPPRSTPT